MNMEPQQYPRRMLLAVTGLSPQVVTETLYALAVAADMPFTPTEVHLITTVEGAERARLTLLSDDPGWFHRLRRDCNLPPISFQEDQIHMMQDGAGKPLEDIRTPDDNESAADFITEQVRILTADPDSALHVSIAGGRKTMGFYLGYALSLYGRKQDRLSHVLVSAPYESNQEFYYPTPYRRVIYTAGPDSRPLDTRDAKVSLAEIPFVSLRHGMPEQLLEGQASFSRAVKMANLEFGPPELIVTIASGTITAGGEEIRLSPVDYVFYTWSVLRGKRGQEPLACPKDGVPEKGYAREFMRTYHAVINEMDDDERTSAALENGMDKNFFERRKSTVNKRLKNCLGRAAEPYLIHRFGRRSHWRHGLKLESGSIRIYGGGKLAMKDGLENA